MICHNNQELTIFILTYNRADLLEQTLISLINQTVQGFKIIVLDNGSTDNTPEIVERYKSHGVELNRIPQNIGGEENFLRAQKLANSRWTMIFHDDDLIHPGYIETAIKYLDKYDNIAVLSTAYTTKEELVNDNWKKLNTKAIYCKDVKELAAYMYCGKNYNFAATIYKTEIFKKIKPKNNIYGKMADKPFVLDAIQHGVSIVLKNKGYIRYRLHEGQDTNDYSSGPFLKEVLELNKLFYQILGGNPFNQYGRVFIARNFKWLKNGYYWAKADNNQYTLWEFVDKAFENESATFLSKLFGKFRKNLFFNIIRGISHLLLCKKYKIINI